MSTILEVLKTAETFASGNYVKDILFRELDNLSPEDFNNFCEGIKTMGQALKIIVEGDPVSVGLDEISDVARKGLWGNDFMD